MKPDILETVLTAIASYRLNIGTLKSRNADSLDFHDLSVWRIREALADAFAAGERHSADLLELLREALHALNCTPRFRYAGNRNSYDLASRITDALIKAGVE